ncbi:hypothetical protein GOP47_0000909 [Adiantum capillus-veneris]|uniref:Uncharacterized protein n=1 Tax=Adiantum capillus-veneris TaxID=13818 RepID=A0A9D4VEU3_ADICA|nr:hypothetical protein GOP47_0000909 [Adiantum capillus-veneris]
MWKLKGVRRLKMERPMLDAPAETKSKVREEEDGKGTNFGKVDPTEVKMVLDPTVEEIDTRIRDEQEEILRELHR